MAERRGPPEGKGRGPPWRLTPVHNLRAPGADPTPGAADPGVGPALVSGETHGHHNGSVSRLTLRTELQNSWRARQGWSRGGNAPRLWR